MLKHPVHDSLERGWGLGKSKGQYPELVVAKRSSTSSATAVANRQQQVRLHPRYYVKIEDAIQIWESYRQGRERVENQQA